MSQLFEPFSDQELLIKFGKHVKELRLRKGLTSAEVARSCDMDRGNYTRIETGKTTPALVTLKKLCLSLDISFKVLFEEFH